MKNILNFISTLYNIRRDFICISLWVVVIGVIMIPQLMHAQVGIANHYKTWMIQPQTVDTQVLVQDQFMEDSLRLLGIELLSNPTLKVHESQSFPIIDPDDHLTWYRAVGRDTSINLAFKNQFESTAVSISQVEYLLVPTQKQGHGPPTYLDHYKAYRIMDAQMIRTPVMLEDQFDNRYGSPENIDSLLPTFFLTPAVKNLESQLYDSVTHYVAYMIFPPRDIPPPLWEYSTTDQFGEHYLQIMHSMFLLVPSEKFISPPPADTGKNHYKTWKTAPQPYLNRVSVEDQFMADSLQLLSIEFLSNPAQKIHGADTFDVIKPNDHLVWYRAEGNDTLLMVAYINQFESRDVTIDSVRYLLVPAQKFPHDPPVGLDHYKAYRIIDPLPLDIPITLKDQFDDMIGTPEDISALVPVYFITPAMKNMEQIYDSVVHYVAYDILPKREFQYTVNTEDQFGMHELSVLNSDLLLLPTWKQSVTPVKPECNDGVDNDGDGLIDFPADCGCTDALDNSEAPNPANQCSDGIDNDGDGLIDFPADPGCSDVCDNDESNPPPPDTGKNHYKTWKTAPQPYLNRVSVEDQFMADSLQLLSIEFLSNPAQKIHGADTFDIIKPNDHLTWYRAEGNDTLLMINYVNQFGEREVVIDSVKYLLVPAQKFPHDPPVDLDHYKAYRIIDPVPIDVTIMLNDQFDDILGTPEEIGALVPVYFLTPAIKNMEQLFDSVVHYVAYDILPKRGFQYIVNTADQFGIHELGVLNSDLLLVPTWKQSVTPMKPECNDGVDNDGDGLIDFPADCGCTDTLDNSEAPNPANQCSDGIDNDQDGLIDFPADPGCSDVCDNDESNLIPQCNDGVDNDGDGLIDYPADCGCTDTLDNTEAPNPPTQCSDGIDNDGDGLIDFPADPGCSDVCDTNETDPPPQCNDGVDNDGDGLIDYPADCGCTDTLDNTEAPNPANQCSDGIDNDGDGLIDFPADPGCSDVCDNDESNPPLPDTGKSHYKTWEILPLQFNTRVSVQDQFMTDSVQLIGIEYLSNPVRKIHGLDTFNIVKPNDHLTWYRAIGKKEYLTIEYVNQFEFKSVKIDSVCFLLVPTQKLPHDPPRNLDHYKAYRIINPESVPGPIRLLDQFDELYPREEYISSLLAKYFLTPVSKNMEPIYDDSTHYVAYEILPKGGDLWWLSFTNDQFGSHEFMVKNSDLLLVPTTKVSVSSPLDSLRIDFKIGWNMLSVPLLVDDFRKTTLFPTAISKAFTYITGYVTRETLDVGPGYWLKFSDTGHVHMTGYWCDPETIDVNVGWNMIGSASAAVCTCSITSIPGGIITSNFFGYDGSTYQKTDTIHPGNAYWVKVNQAGQLILSSSGVLLASNRIKIVPTSELPPLPPDEKFTTTKVIPKEFTLEQNYPNPFNPTTIFKYQLPIDCWVTLKVYNVLGQEIATLIDENQVAGFKSVEFDATKLSSGIYMYKINAGTFVNVKKMVLLK